MKGSYSLGKLYQAAHDTIVRSASAMTGPARPLAANSKGPSMEGSPGLSGAPGGGARVVAHARVRRSEKSGIVLADVHWSGEQL